MATIDSLMFDVADPGSVEEFYDRAFGVRDRVRVRASQTRTTGFRGFTLSLVVSQPADVDRILESALDCGAVSLKPAKKSLWGYGGAVQAPDGTICTVASTSKKDTGSVTRQIDDVVLQLGVADVAASKRFYLDHGFSVAKSYGRRYVEFDTGPVKLTLNKRGALAKVAGVPAEGAGAHGLTIRSDAGRFTDPDGFVWEGHHREPGDGTSDVQASS